SATSAALTGIDHPHGPDSARRLIAEQLDRLPEVSRELRRVETDGQAQVFRHQRCDHLEQHLGLFGCDTLKRSNAMLLPAIAQVGDEGLGELVARSRLAPGRVAGDALRERSAKRSAGLLHCC